MAAAQALTTAPPRGLDIRGPASDPSFVQFRIANIPIRIQPMFFIISAMMGSTGGSFDGPGLGIWIAAALISVLFHELGHAFAGRALGLTPSIELYGGGGLTSFTAATRPVSTMGSIGISLAGPIAGFALGGLVYVLGPYAPAGYATRFVRDMLWCNIGWGLLNLLPILPLDGGRVVERVLRAITPGRAERIARIVSIVVAALAGLWALVTGWQIGILYALWLGAPNVMALRAGPAHPAAGAPGPATGAKAVTEALGQGNPELALRLAEELWGGSTDPRVRAQAITLMGYVAIAQGRFGDLDALLGRTPAGFARDPWLQGVVLLDSASLAGEQAANDRLRSGYTPWVATQTLLALAKAGRKEHATRVFLATAAELEPAQCAELGAKLLQAGAADLAALVAKHAEAAKGLPVAPPAEPLSPAKTH